MPTALTIAGFDPSSGAGVTADLMVFRAHRLVGTAAITTLTVQSTLGVESSTPVDAHLLAATLRCLNEDLPPAGIKIGALGSAATLAEVVRYIAGLRRAGRTIPVVLDPVLRSSSGRELLEEKAVAMLIEELLPLVDWVTPNLDELGLLAGERVPGKAQVGAAAVRLQQRFGGRLGVFATGGHLEPPDDLIVTSAGEQEWLAGRRVETRATHGTGCALSSAFLANLVLGLAPFAAARSAKAYVAGAMEHAEEYGSGACGMNHLWRFGS